MSGTTPPGGGPRNLTPPATKLRKPRFQLVWLIPLIAAVIAGYLGYRTFMEQGPLLTLSFNTAEGVVAGQTQLKYKAVALGTVESIDLSPDNSHVIIKVRMNKVGGRFLTTHARYWVVRPRFNVSDVSGIETLISGAYITVDPGKPGGGYQDHFKGLEEPPGVRSDEPGSTYTLTADSAGSFNSGSPIFYRDVAVGEVLGYDMGNGLGPVKISIFIRAPFDRLVRPDTRFWNTSGIALGVQGGVLQLQLRSIQALLAGGIVLMLPDSARGESPSPDNSIFPLYPSEQAAQAASYANQLKLITFMSGDVSGLTPGSPVVVQGIQIGVVSAVTLQLEHAPGTTRVRVDMNVQPGRIDPADDDLTAAESEAEVRQLVQNGLRATLATQSYVTGQKEISFVTKHDAPPATVTKLGDALVVPSVSGGLDDAIAAVNQLATKLNQMPFKKLGEDLDKLLVTTNSTLGGPQVKQLLQQLTETLKTADSTLNVLNQGFGTDSEFQRGLQQLLQQTTTTEQSVQTLSDYLTRHPQALLLGRAP